MPKDMDQKEIDRSGIQFTSDANTSINSSALSSSDMDEDSLSEAFNRNPFVLSLMRSFIKLKNHISTIPMIMSIVCMMVITFTIHTHLIAINKLSNNMLNSFLFFVNCILSLVAVLVYMNVNSKKSSTKKKVIFMVLFYAVTGLEVFINFRYLRDINIEINLFNNLNKITDTPDGDIAKSFGYTTAHNICLFIEMGLVALAPIVQPFTKKIHFNRKKKQ